jgi:hypothetical protein
MIILQENTEFVFQEASIVNIVRAYITVNTRPLKRNVTLKDIHAINLKEGCIYSFIYTGQILIKWRIRDG